jgi:hypothetical protein
MKRTLTALLNTAAACSFPLLGLTALANQTWLERYDGVGGNNHPYGVALDSSGDAIVTGSSANLNGTDDLYTAKYAAADGHVIWEARYESPFGGDSRGTGVAIDGAGNVIVTGYSANGTSLNGNAPFDFYTAKYAAADGHLLWERRGPFSPGPALATDAERINRVAVDRDGNVVVTGFSNGQVPCCNRSFYTQGPVGPRAGIQGGQSGSCSIRLRSTQPRS